MRVPHECETRLAGRRIGDRAGRWRGTRRTRRADRRVWTQVGAAAVPGTVGEKVRIRQCYRAAAGHIAERGNLKRLVVILAPLVEIDRGRYRGVVAVRIGNAWRVNRGRRGGFRGGVVAVRIPVQSLAGPLEDAVHREAGCGGRGEEQRTGQVHLVRSARGQNQVAVAPENAHVVAVLVERVLPAALADDPQQYQFAWMHMRI